SGVGRWVAFTIASVSASGVVKELLLVMVEFETGGLPVTFDMTGLPVVVLLNPMVEFSTATDEGFSVIPLVSFPTSGV
ncbi:hypothetical protein, partial [Staphylococcus aureus]|uniref:hypothetical protein n=1 Tax=Staphylococcus aureus TaxID=1280 RepID=UPI0038B31161